MGEVGGGSGRAPVSVGQVTRARAEKAAGSGGDDVHHNSECRKRVSVSIKCLVKCLIAFTLQFQEVVFFL